MRATGAAPAIELGGVSVRRGGRTVLRDISCSVPEGRLVGLIGPNGCGKTTLMRTIVGVQANVQGDVSVLGRPADQAARSGQVGYMTQDPSVYGDLTVSQNLTYFGRLLGVGSDRVQAVLSSVHLREAADTLVDRLSGGQRARVSLAVALLNGPRLLVLDEPTVGLDPVLRRQLWAEFSELATDDTTIMVSSHVMDEARRCDELLLMREGRILAAGSPAELMTRTGTTNIEAAFVDLVDAGDG